MIALWMALVVDDRGALQTTITPGDVAAVLRGDDEFLWSERQFAPRMPQLGAGGHPFFDDVFFREVLCFGSSSSTEMTGGCVPRRAAWLN